MGETSTISRIDVVLNAVESAWLSTTAIANIIWDRDFTWSADTTRAELRTLADQGTIERQKVGRSYYWRLWQVPVRVSAAEIVNGIEVPIGEPRTTTMSRGALDLVQAEAAEHEPAVLVETLKRLAAALGVPLALLAPPSEQRAHDLSSVLAALGELDAPDLGHLHEEILKRAIRRAAYDMGKTLLDFLNGWIETALENNPFAPETFHPDDIRWMVNDAARIMGAPEPYNPEASWRPPAPE